MMNEPIRPGCRGGHDQFRWDSLRTMKYHDREQYLGQTTIVGYLDKGGKWRKKDWYLKVNKDEMDNEGEELNRAREVDERRMRIALGIEKPEDGPKGAVEVGKVRLTKEEMEQLIKKTKSEKYKFKDDDEEEKEDENKGLGFETKNKKLKLVNETYGQNILEAYGIQDEYKLKNEKVDVVQKKIKKVKQDKKEKKQKKKEKSSKKDKKEEKEKKHQKEKKNKKK